MFPLKFTAKKLFHQRKTLWGGTKKYYAMSISSGDLKSESYQNLKMKLRFGGLTDMTLLALCNCSLLKSTWKKPESGRGLCTESP